ncbi:MAG TPA: proline racemase family protein [Thermoplasmata archaeon]|nr:proline racemase family protein [Thermoplasmata archaeon]
MARRSVRYVDSHTEGEPTRVVIAGGPTLGPGTLAERRDRLRSEHDRFRRSVVLEPRGTDGLVGALLTEPEDPDHAAGTIFFNNVGYLGMCGHGTIGLVATLAFLGRAAPGPMTIDTPVGPVETELRPSGTVAVRNVESFRAATAVPLRVPEYGELVGDVAWGGNWFYLVRTSPVPVERGRLPELVRFATAVRRALDRSGTTGTDGAVIDHIELSGPPADPRNSARNFVLCPGGAYDRSPCGTGTSATMACRYADGRLEAGAAWRQEGILGGVFEGSVVPSPRGVRPTIAGRAFVTGAGDLLFDDDDPFADGIEP